MKAQILHDQLVKNKKTCVKTSRPRILQKKLTKNRNFKCVKRNSEFSAKSQ